MLDSLRNAGRTWVAKVLLGLLIVSVAAFGIPSVFLDLGANTVARVGEQDISARDFERLYRSQLNQFSAQTGQVPTPDQAVSFGLPGTVLSRLANEAALEDMANRMDLGASDERLALLVRQDPSFSGSLGAFDRQQYTRLLQQSGFTESEYLNLQRRAAKRQQIAMAMFDGLPAPQTALDIAYRYENDQRSIEYVVLNPVSFQSIEEPDDAEIAQFFEENQSRFQTEEIRRVTLLPLTPEALAAGIELSDAQVEAEFERTASQFTTEETRTVHQLPLSGDAVAAFQEGETAGADFQELVAEAGLEGSVSELGTFTRAQMTDPNLAAAAFELAEGNFTVISGALGQRAIWVSEITEGGQANLEDVRETVEQNLRIAQARDSLLQAYDDIEEARAAFLPIEDVAAQYGLEVHDVELTRSGAALADITTIPEAARQNVIDQVFAASETANITPAVNLGGNQAIFFDVEEVLPVRDQTLDEVRDEVIAAWQELQSDLAMIDAAETMVAAIDDGADIFTVASEAGQVPQASQPFGRVGAGDGIITADVARAAFQGGQGYAGYAQTANGEIVVFEVTNVQPATGEPEEQLAGLIGQGFNDNLYAAFITGVQQDTGLRINQQTLNRIVGLD